MAKYDYFETLEEFAKAVSQTVTLSCRCATSTAPQDSIRAQRSMLDNKLCRMENALFCDFLPPLERDNIASFAHCLLHTHEVAAEHGALPRISQAPTEEETLCVSLAQELHKSTTMLRRIRKPGELPDLRRFRDLLRHACEAHRTDMEKQAQGILPRGTSQIILSAGKLRMELSQSFDELIEVMLNNI